MKCFILLSIIVLFLSLPYVSAQKSEDVFLIRNYQQSSSIVLAKGTHSSFVTADHGNIVALRGRSDFRYIYQGQERSISLQLILFPSRFYSINTKCFVHPDPKSQYHSPYLFVGADPINYVDRNGKQGKPLILYGLDDKADEVGPAKAVKIMEGKIDAHYVSIPDFVNNKVADLPEWNGNVYIDSHTNAKGEIVGERYKVRREFQTEEKAISRVSETEGGGIQAFVKNEAIGVRLNEMSEKTGTTVKNIVSGGCMGGKAAERVGDEYTYQQFLLEKEPEVYSYGLREDNVAFHHNPIPAEGAEPETFLSVFPEAKAKEMMMIRSVEGKMKALDGDFNPYPTADINDLRELVNGRIPGEFRSFMPKYVHTFAY